MSNTTDQLAPSSNVLLDEFSVAFNTSSLTNLTFTESSLANITGSFAPTTTPLGKAPPPDENNPPPPPPPSPSPPPMANNQPPPFGTNEAKSPESDDSASASSRSDSPPPPPLAPPPSPSPSNSEPHSSKGPPSPSSSPPLQIPPPPSPPLTQNVSFTLPSSNQAPPPPQTSPNLPSPPASIVTSQSQNVSAISPVLEPPTPVTPSLSATIPLVPGAWYPPSPPLTATPPSPPMPPTTTEKPTHSDTSSGETSNNSTSVTEPNSDSSSASTANNSSDSGGLVRGAIVGIALVGMAIFIIAIFLFVSRRKKRRSENLAAIHYVPTHGYSVNPDGYYYAQAAPMVNSSGFASPYTSQPPSFPSTTPTHGSFRDHLSYFGSPEVVGLGNSKIYFTYEEIAEMTNNFLRQNLLGEGGFGCVYKGWLTDGRAVAVKQLKHGGGQGEREFRAEVDIISRVHHRHLVSLIGYSIDDDHRSLVYEFLPNKTLEYHLHGKGLSVMEWSKRLRVAVGAARGLAYLHDDCHPKIIHRDIKTANILLDETFEAQVADFGLARLTNDTHTHVSTRVVGTFGYMAPEYASSGKLTDKSDVFSFGVVLLELITGRKPVDTSQPLGEESLVEWARPLLVDALESGNFDVLVDRRLDGNYSKNEMYRMMEAAASCVRHSAAKRPRMVQVLRALDTMGELSDLSNGLKFGQSTIFDSRQYSADIQQFRRMAFGNDSCVSHRNYTEEFDSTSIVQSRECSSSESFCRSLNSGGHNFGGYHNSHEFSSSSLGRQTNETYESSRHKGQGLH